ncbi:MAG TPA: autotransporter domain-containing protein [Accumulibacter sp.]|jgi:hypothetical protein|nr:autotransporter domain-containing protein [Accumulibacter sp.]HQC80695.1 autotransporter domain-containing protein [Accumulibacter sp.]
MAETRSRIDGYTETGGGFPVRWDARTENTTLGRLGADATHAINNNWTLLGRLEGVHRVNRQGQAHRGRCRIFMPSISKDCVTSATGCAPDSVRKIGPGVASPMLNTSSENNGPAHWGHASYRIGF